MDPQGESVALEATGSDRIKIQKIVQACLYQSPDRRKDTGRVFVSSIEERLEVPRSLTGTINSNAPSILAFLSDYPEAAAQLFLPHPDLCPQCDTSDCPHGNRNQFTKKGDRDMIRITKGRTGSDNKESNNKAVG